MEIIGLKLTDCEKRLDISIEERNKLFLLISVRKSHARIDECATQIGGVAEWLKAAPC